MIGVACVHVHVRMSCAGENSPECPHSYDRGVSRSIVLVEDRAIITANGGSFLGCLVYNLIIFRFSEPMRLAWIEPSVKFYNPEQGFPTW